MVFHISELMYLERAGLGIRVWLGFEGRCGLGSRAARASAFQEVGVREFGDWGLDLSPVTSRKPRTPIPNKLNPNPQILIPKP